MNLDPTRPHLSRGALFCRGGMPGGSRGAQEFEGRSPSLADRDERNMQEQASAETAPEVRSPAAAAPSPPVPSDCRPSPDATTVAGRGRTALRLLLAPFVAFARRPRRALGVLFLCVLLGL